MFNLNAKTKLRCPRCGTEPKGEIVGIKLLTPVCSIYVDPVKVESYPMEIDRNSPCSIEITWYCPNHCTPIGDIESLIKIKARLDLYNPNEGWVVQEDA